MSRVAPTYKGSLIGDDVSFTEEAAALYKRIGGDRRVAQKYAFMWLVIQATIDGTTPGAILDRLRSSAPPEHAQRTIVAGLRRRLIDQELDD